MVAIDPTANKLWGSRPTGILLC